MNIESLLIFISFIGVIALIAKQFATPLPVSDDKFKVMAEMVKDMRVQQEKMQKRINELEAELALYKARFGEIQKPANKLTVKKLVETGRLEEALHKLSQVISVNDPENTSISILLQELTRIETHKATNLLSESEYSKALNRISSAILDIDKGLNK